jgi:transcriptional regulator
MSFMTERQVKVLKLWREGKRGVEIAKELGIRPSSVLEAVKRGNRNIDKTIRTLEILLRENIFTPHQISSLKRLLRGIDDSRNAWKVINTITNKK